MKVPSNVGEQLHAIRCELGGLATEMIKQDYIDVALAALIAVDRVQTIENKLEDLALREIAIAPPVSMDR
jgi:hypothetical protein